MARNLTISEAARRLNIDERQVLPLCRKAHIHPTKYAYDLGDGFACDLTEYQLQMLEQHHWREIARLRRANERRRIRCSQLTLDV